MNYLYSLYMLDDDIQVLKKKLRELEKDRKETLNTIVEAGTTEDGSYSLSQTVKSSRTVNIRKFKDAVGSTWAEYADVKVSIKSAGGVLGKKEIDAVCDIIEKTAYSVVKGNG